MKLGLVQMPVTDVPEHNLSEAVRLTREMAQQGADLVLLPEMFLCPYENSWFRRCAQPERGRIFQALGEAAAGAGVYLAAGSFPEEDREGRLYNTGYVFDRQGRELARHRKMHLFDIQVEGGQCFRESDTFSPGDTYTVFDTEFGRMGLCICFDIRFPELFSLMVQAGARLVLVPAAFNRTTGPAHWDLVFRQRAVDGQCFTAGAAPARDPAAAYVSYGHSLVVSPWGEVIRRFGTGEQAEVVELDLRQTDAVRKQLPLLSAWRTDLYETRWKKD